MTTKQDNHDLPDDKDVGSYTISAEDWGVIVYEMTPTAVQAIEIAWDEILPLVNALIEFRQEYVRRNT